MVAPLLDDDSRLLQTVEDFPVEALVAQLAVERFAVAIFPGTAGLDVERALRITAHDLCGLRAIAGVLLSQRSVRVTLPSLRWTVIVRQLRRGAT